VPREEASTLWAMVTSARHSAGPVFFGASASISLVSLSHVSSLSCSFDELRGRSILLATKDQLAAALALIELDGIVRRIVLSPPDLPVEQIPAVVRAASIDAVVCGQGDLDIDTAGIERVVSCTSSMSATAPVERVNCQTEWILLTSGTTGLPKLVIHTLSSLTAPIKNAQAGSGRTVWGTFYDIRRYGGLQIFLRAVLGGASLILSSPGEPTGGFLKRAGGAGVTHISGTPSHWRGALMSPQINAISPRYVRLSGEIADQAVLDHLRSVFPNAAIGHAFASTEAGVAFEVNDGFAGFPAHYIERESEEVELKVVDGSLRIRSTRIASGYLGALGKELVDSSGFIDTGDMVERRGGRFYFIGRADGTINVGGRKVHPEEVEAIINRHPSVQMSLVKGRRSPITGAVVVADVVLERSGDDADPVAAEALRRAIIADCRHALAPHKVPAAIQFVPALSVTGSGKLARFDA
jgi:acyl-coenzyme A synthetase/AMP-(fatty) acid ligase